MLLFQLSQISFQDKITNYNKGIFPNFTAYNRIIQLLDHGLYAVLQSVETGPQAPGCN